MGAEYRKIIETFRVAIFDTIPEPLIVLDSHLVVLTANEGFYNHFKVPPEETIGKNIFDVGNKQWDIPDLRRLLEKILPEKSTIREFQVIHEFPTIGKRVMLLSANTIHSREFIPLDLILIVLQDVTEKKNWTDSILAYSKKCEYANNDLERFGHALSHDLRAPVSAMVGFSKMIMEDYGSEINETLKEYISRVIQNAETMNRMIEGLSQLAGLSHSSVTRTMVSLSEIADKVISQLRENEPQRSVDVTIKRDMVESVEPCMFLVFLTNLLKNSWKFTRDKLPAKIVFDVNQENGKKTYFVKDNGIGFDMRFANNLFNMFQRLPTGKDFEGSGTGLAIAKSIIDKHYGEIWAFSEEGKGTTVYFTIGH